MFALERLEQLEKKQNDKNSCFKVPLPVDKDAKAIQKLLHLKKKRDKLRKMKQDLDEQILLEKKKLSVVEEEQNTVEYAQEKTEYEKLQDYMDCYRLIGVSVLSEENNSLMLCFDNNYSGRILETYYVELERRVDKHFHLKRHTLPSFLSVESLAEKHLVNCLGDFISAVEDHLVAFVSRREEVKKTKELMKEGTAMEITMTTESFDYIEMVLGDDSGPVKLKISLAYTDLQQNLPGKVAITSVIMRNEEASEDFKDTLQKWKIILQHKLLSEAMGSIMLSFPSVLSNYFSPPSSPP